MIWMTWSLCWRSIRLSKAIKPPEVYAWNRWTFVIFSKVNSNIVSSKFRKTFPVLFRRELCTYGAIAHRTPPISTDPLPLQGRQRSRNFQKVIQWRCFYFLWTYFWFRFVKSFAPTAQFEHRASWHCYRPSAPTGQAEKPKFPNDHSMKGVFVFCDHFYGFLWSRALHLGAIWTPRVLALLPTLCPYRAGREAEISKR